MRVFAYRNPDVFHLYIATDTGCDLEEDEVIRPSQNSELRISWFVDRLRHTNFLEELL